MNVEEYIDMLDSPLKEISQELRAIVTGFLPEIKEQMKWNVPTSSLNKGICSIVAHKKHVNFQIFRGAHIEDAEELEGTGKDMRHLRFSSLADIDRSRIEKYLGQAVELDR